MAITMEELRAHIASVTALGPEEIGLDDNLADLGLDSMRFLNLILLCEESGVTLDFGTASEDFTLSGLWEQVEAQQAGAGNAAQVS